MTDLSPLRAVLAQRVEQGLVTPEDAAKYAACLDAGEYVAPQLMVSNTAAGAAYVATLNASRRELNHALAKLSAAVPRRVRPGDRTTALHIQRVIRTSKRGTSREAAPRSTSSSRSSSSSRTAASGSSSRTRPRKPDADDGDPADPPAGDLTALQRASAHFIQALTAARSSARALDAFLDIAAIRLAAEQARRWAA